MNNRSTQTRQVIKLLLLAVFSLACSSVTITVGNEQSSSESLASEQQVGFDFVDQTPEFSQGDTSASLHLFLHKYQVPSDGVITGITYLNDSDTLSESFDVLILRPDHDAWKVIHRIDVSDDSPAARTGVTVFTLPSSLPVQKNDIFAHWQYEAEGAVPLNGDSTAYDGFSVGLYGFHSADLEVGQYINKDGFTGQRDYFINMIFSPAR